MAIRATSKPGRLLLANFRYLAGDSTGVVRIIRSACSGVSSNTFFSAPKPASRDMTILSRTGSSGGFVPWADVGRQHGAAWRPRRDHTALGPSPAMEPTA